MNEEYEERLDALYRRMQGQLQELLMQYLIQVKENNMNEEYEERLDALYRRIEDLEAERNDMLMEIRQLQYELQSAENEISRLENCGDSHGF